MTNEDKREDVSTSAVKNYIITMKSSEDLFKQFQQSLDFLWYLRCHYVARIQVNFLEKRCVKYGLEI